MLTDLADQTSAKREIARVLKPGGKGAPQEPLGHNRLLEFARDYLPYKNKHPVKGTDLPLFIADVERFGGHFKTCSYRGFGLTGMAGKLLRLRRDTSFCHVLDWFDEYLFDRVPYIQRYARYSVICVTE